MDVTFLLLLAVICAMIDLHTSKIMTTFEYQRIMEKLFKGQDFKRWSIPTDRDKPVVVRLSLTFIDMVPLDFYYNHIFAEVLIHQEWEDKRLIFNSSLANATIILTGDNVNDIWLPDTWIANERGEPKTTFPATESTAQLTQRGYVYYTARFSIYVFCPMEYTYFPFDRQQCVMPLESYGYNREMMKLMPNENTPTVSFRDDFRIEEFILDQNQGVEVVTSEVDYGLTGLFERVEIRLSLRRHVYYYLVEYYFPVALVVATSWISFWIDYRCTAARATLPVTTFLTLTTMAETLRAKDAGSLFHSTIFEVYINVCTFYVFAVLIEYAIIEATYHFLKRSAKKSKNEVDNNGASGASLQCIEDINIEPISYNEVQLERKNHTSEGRSNCDLKQESELGEGSSSGTCPIRPEKNSKLENNPRNNIIDEYSKAIFPISFIAFAICYVLVCLSSQ